MRMKLTTTYYDDLPYQIIQELEASEKFYDLQLFNIERNDCYLITENEQMKKMKFVIVILIQYFYKKNLMEKFQMTLEISKWSQKKLLKSMD